MYAIRSYYGCPVVLRTYRGIVHTVHRAAGTVTVVADRGVGQVLTVTEQRIVVGIVTIAAGKSRTVDVVGIVLRMRGVGHYRAGLAVITVTVVAAGRTWQ